MIIDYFGRGHKTKSAKCAATAKALGVTRQGVERWLENGIPGPRQAQIAEMTPFLPDKKPWE